MSEKKSIPIQNSMTESLLYRYFGDLLNETDETDETDETTTDAEIDNKQAVEAVGENAEIVVTPINEEVISHPIEAEFVDQQAEPSPKNTEDQSFTESSHEVASATPAWMEKTCAVLFFYTQSARLAIPIILLGKIIKPRERISRIPNMPEWRMGVMRYGDKFCSIIDTDAILNECQKNDDVSPTYILMIAETTLGLSCESLGDIVDLEPQQIQWRKTNNTARRWHIGTVRDSLHLLLDPSQINKMYG